MFGRTANHDPADLNREALVSEARRLVNFGADWRTSQSAQRQMNRLEDVAYNLVLRYGYNDGQLKQLCDHYDGTLQGVLEERVNRGYQSATAERKLRRASRARVIRRIVLTLLALVIALFGLLFIALQLGIQLPLPFLSERTEWGMLITVWH